MQRGEVCECFTCNGKKRKKNSLYRNNEIIIQQEKAASKETAFGTPGETRTHYLTLRRNDYPVFLIIIVSNSVR